MFTARSDWVFKYSSGWCLFCVMLTVNMQSTATISIRPVNQSAWISAMGIVRVLVKVFTPGHHVRPTYTLLLFISINGVVAVSGHILYTKGSLATHLQIFQVICSLQFYLRSTLSCVPHARPFYRPKNIWRGLYIMKFLILKYFAYRCFFLSPVQIFSSPPSSRTHLDCVKR